MGLLFLVLFALVGLYIGDKFGPATGLVLHWDFGYPAWLSSYVYYHHYFQLGMLTSAFSIFAALLFRIHLMVPLGVTLAICCARFMLEPLRVGEPFRLEYLAMFVPYIIPVAIGILTSVGIYTMLNETKLAQRLFR